MKAWKNNSSDLFLFLTNILRDGILDGNLKSCFCNY